MPPAVNETTIRPLRLWRIVFGVLLALRGVLGLVRPALPVLTPSGTMGAIARAFGLAPLIALLGLGAWVVRSGLAWAAETDLAQMRPELQEPSHPSRDRQTRDFTTS